MTTHHHNIFRYRQSQSLCFLSNFCLGCLARWWQAVCFLLTTQIILTVHRCINWCWMSLLALVDRGTCSFWEFGIHCWSPKTKPKKVKAQINHFFSYCHIAPKSCHTLAVELLCSRGLLNCWALYSPITMGVMFCVCCVQVFLFVKHHN